MEREPEKDIGAKGDQGDFRSPSGEHQWKKEGQSEEDPSFSIDNAVTKEIEETSGHENGDEAGVEVWVAQEKVDSVRKAEFDEGV